MTKYHYKLKSMLEEWEEENTNITLSPIKGTKRFDSRKSAILIPDNLNNELCNINTNINRDINLENNKIN